MPSESCAIQAISCYHIHSETNKVLCYATEHKLQQWGLWITLFQMPTQVCKKGISSPHPHPNSDGLSGSLGKKHLHPLPRANPQKIQGKEEASIREQHQSSPKTSFCTLSWEEPQTWNVCAAQVFHSLSLSGQAKQWSRGLSKSQRSIWFIPLGANDMPHISLDGFQPILWDWESSSELRPGLSSLLPHKHACGNVVFRMQHH